MASYNYVDTVNPNLVCCICRMPFVNPIVTRTCEHTFCRECIIKAIDVLPQCPVDRSPLSSHDILPSNPIVRNLVDELLVECPHRSSGCLRPIQRYLLALHLKDSCGCEQVPCSELGCEQVVLRKDLGKHADSCVHRLVSCDGCGVKVSSAEMDSHYAECPIQEVTCSFCSSNFTRSEMVAHNDSCPDFVIPCSHSSNGCLWTGPRSALLQSHIPSCSFEAIKGFFVLNDARFSALTSENVTLRQKCLDLEGVVQSLKRELQIIKTALGPWYRSDGVQPPFIQDMTVESPSHPSPLSESFFSLTQSSLLPNIEPSNSTVGLDILSSPPSRSQHIDLSPYFPPLHDPTSPQPYADHHVQPYTYAHASTSSTPQSQVAPLNLSTSLEGTLSSLRGSIVTLASTLNSLSVRHDIALTAETSRLNEDVRSLKVVVHGLRMQVHNIMSHLNAQVTGRFAESAQGWPTSITKL